MSNRRSLIVGTAAVLAASIAITLARCVGESDTQVDRRSLEKRYRAAGFPWEVADLHLPSHVASSISVISALPEENLRGELKEAAAAIRSGNKIQAKAVLRELRPEFAHLASKFRNKSVLLPYKPTIHPRAFNFLTRLKDYTKLYSYLGLLDAEVGANEESVADFQSAFQIAQSCKSDPETLTYLLQIALLDILRSNIGRATAYVKENGLTLRRFESLCEALIPNITPKQCCRYEAFDELQNARNNFIRGEREVPPPTVKDNVLTGWGISKAAIKNQASVLAYWITFSSSLQDRWNDKSAVNRATKKAQEVLPRFGAQKTFLEENFGFDSAGTILRFNGDQKRKREATELYIQAISASQRSGTAPATLRDLPMYSRLGTDQRFFQYLPARPGFTISVKRDPSNDPLFKMGPLLQISYPPRSTDRW